MKPLYTVEAGTSAYAVSRLLAVLFPDATTVLDQIGDVVKC